MKLIYYMRKKKKLRNSNIISENNIAPADNFALVYPIYITVMRQSNI